MTAIRYPSEFAADAGTDYLEIKFIRRDYTDNSKASYKQEGSTIILNVPQKVTESISQQFANSTMGEMGPFLGNRSGSGNFFGNAAKRVVENFALGKSVEVANKLGASQFTDNGILSATSGIVFNPNLEVLYEGPDFRSFNFQFALFTKSSADAKNIKKIVDAFREASLPSATGAKVDAGNLAGVFTDAGTVDLATGAAQSLIGTGIKFATGKSLADAIKGGLSNGLNSIAGGLGTLGAAAAAGSNLIFTGDNRFIKQPPFVLMTYKRGASEHPFIKPLLPAAINQLSFDFTPTGNYTQLANFDATKEATTIGVNITMQITEVTNLFSDTLFTKRAPGVS
jgi:hypothetical protein